MKTLAQIQKELRHFNHKNYRLLFLCSFFSVLLITAYVTMMCSKTVLTILPVGGDSRKQVMAVFVMAVIGCGVFVSYTATLFFKYKSKETGILMALGASKKQLKKQLYLEIICLALGSCTLGALLGTPLAYGIWQAFKFFVVNTKEMTFIFAPQAYLFALAFTLFVILILFIMGNRFINQSNIIDVVNSQRKSEPIHDVKSWYGWGGILLMVIGGGVGYYTPTICIKYFKWYPPAWVNITFLPLFVGLYLVLLYTVIHGWRKAKNRYKDIIPRSMMKFQGRQTVNNMLVITVLLAGAYFASFYTPMLTTGAIMAFNNREVDYQFHYRQDQNMLTQEDISNLAEKYQVDITSYNRTEFANLGRDGEHEVDDKGGKYHYEYEELLSEGNYMSATTFMKVTGQKISVGKGKFRAVLCGDGSGDYMVPTDTGKLTNPVTGEQIKVSFDKYLYDDMLTTYYVLNDEDYDTITKGLTGEWKEYLVDFNVANVDTTYAFAKKLYQQIILHSNKACEVSDNYDRIEKMIADKKGETYWMDALDTSEINYQNTESSEFKMYWKYAPKFRILDIMDFNTNFAVFLMLFIFIAIICFAAVFVIAYTRCMTVALNNQQIYDDLRHLGANHKYLYQCIKSQIGKVFKAPVVVGTTLIYLLYFMIMYGNDSGRLTAGEVVGMRNCGILIIVMTFVIYTFYKITLKNVCRILKI